MIIYGAPTSVWWSLDGEQWTALAIAAGCGQCGRVPCLPACPVQLARRARALAGHDDPEGG